jgi:hypothetical protein
MNSGPEHEPSGAQPKHLEGESRSAGEPKTEPEEISHLDFSLSRIKKFLFFILFGTICLQPLSGCFHAEGWF